MCAWLGVRVFVGNMQGKSLLPTFEERNDSKGQHPRRDYGTELSDKPSNSRVGVLACDVSICFVAAIRPFAASPTAPHLSSLDPRQWSIQLHRGPATAVTMACQVLTNSLPLALLCRLWTAVTTSRQQSSTLFRLAIVLSLLLHTEPDNHWTNPHAHRHTQTRSVWGAGEEEEDRYT